ncbi:MAG: hypothetical protein SFT90_05595 [Rickettsiales bacterium]|nr:hypothetical protein [Rickettsiales bacterium]
MSPNNFDNQYSDDEKIKLKKLKKTEDFFNYTLGANFYGKLEGYKNYTPYGNFPINVGMEYGRDLLKIKGANSLFKGSIVGLELSGEFDRNNLFDGYAANLGGYLKSNFGIDESINLDVNFGYNHINTGFTNELINGLSNTYIKNYNIYELTQLQNGENIGLNNFTLGAAFNYSNGGTTLGVEAKLALPLSGYENTRSGAVNSFSGNTEYLFNIKEKLKMPASMNFAVEQKILNGEYGGSVSLFFEAGLQLFEGGVSLTETGNQKLLPYAESTRTTSAILPSAGFGVRAKF